MPAAQNTVYIHFCGCIVAIRHSSDMIKHKISGSLCRSDLGWKGESARRTLAASLGAHLAQSSGDIRHPGDVKTNKKVHRKRKNERSKKKELKREQEGAWERSDSMEPIRGRVRERVARNEKESYAGWYTLNSNKMRKKKLEEAQETYLSERRFTTTFGNEEASLEKALNEFAGIRYTPEAMTFSSHHLHNAPVKVSSNPNLEVDDLILSDHTRSTDALLRNKPELNTNYDNAGNQCSRSEPYPSSAPAPLPQPPTASRSCRPITPSNVQHPKFSVWPLDCSVPPIIANQHHQSPTLVSSSPTTAQSTFVSSRSRSRIGKQDLSHSSTNYIQEPEEKSRNNRKHKNDDNDDIVFPPDHPFHGLDAQQRRTYWDTLSLYHSSLSSADPKNSSLLGRRDCKSGKRRVVFSPLQHGLCDLAPYLHGEGAAADLECVVVHSLSLNTRVVRHKMMGRVSEATSRAVRLVRSEGNLSTAVTEDEGEERRGRKRGSSSRLRDTFACRPGASTPEVPARTIENGIQPVDVAAVPRKYGMTYLARKMRNTPRLYKRSKDEPKRVHEESQDAREAARRQNTWRDISGRRKSGEQELEIPSTEPRKDDSTNETDQVTNSPVQLPKEIDQTAESTPSTSPTTSMFPSSAPAHISTLPRALSQSPSAAPGIPRMRATSQPPQSQQRRCVSSGSQSLSDRLRTTRLEDLRLRSETAQEIRNLMLDIDRDRRQSLSSTTTATMQRHSLSTVNHSELPGGFITTDPKPQNSSSQPTPSLHDTIERHLQLRRDSNINDNDDHDPTTLQYYQDQKPVRLQPSHSTLPRSYKAPDVHE
ncbi:hypothetical protein yc1106_07309 [Curvularia clavata]|uniref:Uncharacterized protein n=1 Tax=Curvularia clavata TaxID=95742 RepID=A0A9Q9DVJ1_CURCL|nr:hypothetical protein yc1106_07309 [Curvularia clavata]